MEYISFEHNNIAADLVKQAYDTAPLAFVLVWFYNGQRGACSPLQKKAFYWFYPVHLLVLAGITNLML